MQTLTATVLECHLPAPELAAAHAPISIPAFELLERATRELRVSDGYRRLLHAILDDSWTSTDD